eukprot:GILI01009151.1.p2 GENE.GILI01009151.1~~GILI01009151.1.p2  ORF type:complete len:245 (+),score=64.45 GILI01009151.1:42-737(+)
MRSAGLESLAQAPVGHLLELLCAERWSLFDEPPAVRALTAQVLSGLYLLTDTAHHPRAVAFAAVLSAQLPEDSPLFLTALVQGILEEFLPSVDTCAELSLAVLSSLESNAPEIFEHIQDISFVDTPVDVQFQEALMPFLSQLLADLLPPAMFASFFDVLLLCPDHQWRKSVIQEVIVLLMAVAKEELLVTGDLHEFVQGGLKRFLRSHCSAAVFKHILQNVVLHVDLREAR